MQHVGELAATISDELSEGLLFALEGFESLTAFRGDLIGRRTRFLNHTAPFGFELRAQRVKLVPKPGVLQLVRLSALLELPLGLGCRTLRLLQ